MGAYRFALRSQMRTLAPPPRGGGCKNSYQMMRTACTSQYTRCVYLDETLCSCQGARGSAPGAGCWKDRAGRARSPRSFKDCGLPRKEVIQPHVPVRLPCYDFTPLTLHTFDASLARLGRRLRVQTTRVV